jgi:hypothetical protein
MHAQARDRSIVLVLVVLVLVANILVAIIINRPPCIL